MVNVERLTSDLTASGFNENNLEIGLAIAGVIGNRKIHTDNQLRQALMEPLGGERCKRDREGIGKVVRYLIQNRMLTKSKPEGYMLNPNYNDGVR